MYSCVRLLANAGSSPSHHRFVAVTSSQFLPGPGVGFDGLNAERISNFFGIVAIGYTSGADTMAVTPVTFPASVGAADEDATLGAYWALTLEERSSPV